MLLVPSIQFIQQSFRRWNLKFLRERRIPQLTGQEQFLRGRQGFDLRYRFSDHTNKIAENSSEATVFQRLTAGHRGGHERGYGLCSYFREHPPRRRSGFGVRNPVIQSAAMALPAAPVPTRSKLNAAGHRPPNLFRGICDLL